MFIYNFRKILKFQNNYPNIKDFTSNDRIKVSLKIKNKKNLDNLSSNSQVTDSTLSVPLDQKSKVVQASTSSEKPETKKNQKDKKCSPTLSSTKKDSITKTKSKRKKHKSTKLNKNSDQTIGKGIEMLNIQEKSEEKQLNSSGSNTVLIKTSEDHAVDQIQSENVMTVFKPLPRLADQLLTFLSEDLVKKTLEVSIFT